jgi:hypothetical protein
MERYCGKLLPAIKSQRFPYSNFSNRICDVALISALELIYNLDLSFKVWRPLAKKTFSTPECESFQPFIALLQFKHSTDPKSVLLPPHKILDVPAALANKVAISLATCYGITVATARKYIPAQLSQWGKVSRLEGGDTIHARDLVRLSETN